MRKSSKPKPTVTEAALAFEEEHGGGMERIYSFLASLHCETPEAEQQLKDAYTRFDREMEEWGRVIRSTPREELERSKLIPVEVVSNELARRHSVEWAHQMAHTPRR